MKKFILNILGYFILMLIILEVCYTFFLSAENHLIPVKHEYFNSVKDELEIVILGNSHAQFAIDPELLGSHVSNLAVVGSALNVDSILFDYSIQNAIPKVFMVELSRVYVNKRNDKSWISQNRIDYFFQASIYNWRTFIKYRFPIFSMRKLEYDYPKTKAGYIHEDVHEFNLFKKLNYAENKIRNHHLTKKTINSHLNFSSNAEQTEILKYFIQECEDRKIELIFFSTPKSYIYNSKVITESKRSTSKIIEELEKELQTTIHFWNFEALWSDDLELFKDVNHLNTKGGEKFSLFIKDSLESLMAKEQGFE